MRKLRIIAWCLLYAITLIVAGVTMGYCIGHVLYLLRDLIGGASYGW